MLINLINYVLCAVKGDAYEERIALITQNFARVSYNYVATTPIHSMFCILNDKSTAQGSLKT